MNGIGEIERALGVKSAVSAEMAAALDEWENLFKGRAHYLEAGACGMNLAGGIAGEIARLVTVEMQSCIEGGRRADVIRPAYERAIGELRTQVEFAAAGGGIVFKPYADAKGLHVDFVRADCFLPTAFDANGEICAAVFVERRYKNGKTYTKLESHELGAQGYVIKNRAFCGTGAKALASAVSLGVLEEWENLCPEIQICRADGSAPERMLFSYFKMPFANFIDPECPLGVSVYARAADLIKQADIQYNRILWEYEGSELAVDASYGALRPQGLKRLFGGESGREKPVLSLPKRRQRLFRELGVSRGEGGDLYEVFSPKIRDESLFNGLNRLMKRIEFACYLSYGTLSDPQEVEKTAEEIKMGKQRSFSAVCDIQQGLEKALKGLACALDMLACLQGAASWEEDEPRVLFGWGDSISADSEKERLAMRQDCIDGAAAWWEYRMKFYGESEEEARKKIEGIKGCAD